MSFLCCRKTKWWNPLDHNKSLLLEVVMISTPNSRQESFTESDLKNFEVIIREKRIL